VLVFAQFGRKRITLKDQHGALDRHIYLCPPPNPPLDPREYELPEDDEQFS
jgi:hypothetical protein